MVIISILRSSIRRGTLSQGHNRFPFPQPETLAGIADCASRTDGRRVAVGSISQAEVVTNDAGTFVGIYGPLSQHPALPNKLILRAENHDAQRPPWVSGKSSPRGLTSSEQHQQAVPERSADPKPTSPLLLPLPQCHQQQNASAGGGHTAEY